jgi:hypothetical protein
VRKVRDVREQKPRDDDTALLEVRASVVVADHRRLDRAADLVALKLARLYVVHDDQIARVLRGKLPGSNKTYEDRARAVRRHKDRLAALMISFGRDFDERLHEELGTRRQFRNWLEAFASEVSPPRSRDADEAIGEAAYRVSELLRNQHRRDGTTETQLWTNVVAYLRKYGHQLPRSFDHDNARQAARAYAARNRPYARKPVSRKG